MFVVDYLLDVVFYTTMCDLVVWCVEGDYPLGVKIIFASGIFVGLTVGRTTGF